MKENKCEKKVTDRQAKEIIKNHSKHVYKNLLVKIALVLTENRLN